MEATSTEARKRGNLGILDPRSAVNVFFLLRSTPVEIYFFVLLIFSSFILFYFRASYTIPRVKAFVPCRLK
jgi:hypothetical protein